MDMATVENPGIDRKSFDRIAKVVYRESGITLKWEKATLMVGRLSKRLRELNLTGFRQYADLVENSPSAEEMTILLDSMSTNVTYFFREPEHFDILRDVYKGWLKAGQKRLRIWCAAASTGDEPYTIAMTLLDHTPPGVDLRVLATDISTQALAKAIAGQYPERAMENVPKTMQDRYFRRELVAGQAKYTASQKMKNALLFRQFNLVKFPFSLKGPLDFILCRNVMIYFDPPTRQKIVDEFYRLLKPGGNLIISHSESLSDLKIKFDMVRPSVYVKPG